jgi:carbon-monoxide dehydrogenase medium subunit/2-furoyl-CoA dehydrogenase FAD binding subunit
MKPCAFDYIRVDTLDEALSVLADVNLDGKILAGGQSLMPLLNMRLAQPSVLLDINRIAELGTIQQGAAEDGSELLEVGALVRQRQLERYTAEDSRTRLLHMALTNIGHPQTRNQGTVGGSLAHADPSAELPLLFLTLGGTVLLQSSQRERTVAAEDFFQSYLTTALEPNEILTKIWWKLPSPATGIAFKEFRRRHGDFALMAAACVMDLDGQRSVRKVRLGIGGVADTPLLVDEVQQLVGEPWSQGKGQAVAEMVTQRLTFVDDAQASADYRRQLVLVLLSRILEAAYKDAQAKEVGHATHQS